MWPKKKAGLWTQVPKRIVLIIWHCWTIVEHLIDLFINKCCLDLRLMIKYPIVISTPFQLHLDFCSLKISPYWFDVEKRIVDDYEQYKENKSFLVVKISSEEPADGCNKCHCIIAEEHYRIKGKTCNLVVWQAGGSVYQTGPILTGGLWE